MKNKVAIFGSTGSVGVSALEVIRINKDNYEVYALTGHSNLNLLKQQCIEFKPKFAFIKSEYQNKLQEELMSLGLNTVVLSSTEELINLASSNDYQMSLCAVVGSFGILSTYYSVFSGKKVLLANKESLVMAGEIIISTAKEKGAQIIPVDSEHSAIYQALDNPDCNLSENKVSRLILTASGGPLYKLSKEEMQKVTKEQALKHPVWSMGAKISIDSATLMNKGLELIEAYWLFGAEIEQLSAVIHPQHVIHSMVEYIDGSVIAQMSVPDMKLPISYALSLTSRIKSGIPFLDFNKYNRLDFFEIDYSKFPCLQLALDSLKSGGNASLVLSVANEIAVAQFLEDRINFFQISNIIESAVEKFVGTSIDNIQDILELTNEIYSEYQFASKNPQKN
jgi:1-deoxy-D-xylulose-5-phosphate reductoisomerase